MSSVNRDNFPSSFPTWMLPSPRNLPISSQLHFTTNSAIFESILRPASQFGTLCSMACLFPWAKFLREGSTAGGRDNGVLLSE